MPRIIKIRESDLVPAGAKFLQAIREPDPETARHVEEVVGSYGIFPFNGYYYRTRIVMDEATFFLFEVPDFPKGDDSNVL